jgi:hypothetical protein
MGGAATYDSRRERSFVMKKLLIGTGVGVTTFLVTAGAALAVPPSVPAVPVADYGDSLLTGLAAAIGQVFPYAAAITAFAIGVGMVKRWLGHRKATRV